MADVNNNTAGVIGRGLFIKGELHGEEDPEILVDYVRLKNGVRTLAKPDVNLLWIIGGNYFGQTNDARCSAKTMRVCAEKVVRRAAP